MSDLSKKEHITNTEVARKKEGDDSRMQAKNTSSNQQIVLRTENLSKSYQIERKKVTPLRNLLLEIKRGEFVAIMGHSGSGKTTLLNMLGCLDKPTNGEVFVDNIDVSHLRDSDLFKIRRDKIGFVFQSFNLLPYLNARENVELAMESTKKSKKERSHRALELLAKVGLAGREEHKPQELSGGEQQRVAIARALANNPAVILADELTGNLDHKTRNDIMKLLVNLNLQQGTTVVLVTHDNEVAWKTERILRLKNGKIDKEYKGILAKRKEQEQKTQQRSMELLKGDELISEDKPPTESFRRDFDDEEEELDVIGSNNIEEEIDQ
jgi:putative ABC transport system ATP-binding protein